MAWTNPLTWTVGQIVTKAILDLHIKDNLRYLKGQDGVPTIQSGLTLDNSLGTERLLLPLLTTAQCTTALDVEGEVAHDSQTHRIKLHDGTAVRSVVTTVDVDDTPANGATTDPVSSNWAYDFQQALTTAGDLPYATDAGVWARLGIGTALQMLQTNAGATAPQWITRPSGISIVSSSYAGNDANDRQITTGFACKLVLQYEATVGFRICISTSTTIYFIISNQSFNFGTDLILHATDGFIVDKLVANGTGVTYYYVAIG